METKYKIIFELNDNTTGDKNANPLVKESKTTSNENHLIEKSNKQIVDKTSTIKSVATKAIGSGIAGGITAYNLISTTNVFNAELGGNTLQAQRIRQNQEMTNLAITTGIGLVGIATGNPLLIIGSVANLAMKAYNHSLETKKFVMDMVSYEKSQSQERERLVRNISEGSK